MPERSRASPAGTSPALTRPAEVRGLLAELGVHPSKALGQNFLVDANILRILVETAELCAKDSVLEIGPGLGVVTEALLARAARVVAVEKDRRLYEHLCRRFEGSDHLELLHRDVMRVDLGALCASGINKVVANLPYSVGTRALVELMEQAQPPERMVVTVQEDVAERLVAEPGTRAYGTVSVLAQTRYDLTLRKVVAAGCFFPPPQVRSAIVKLEQLRPRPASPGNRSHFRALVKHSFHHRRKQMSTVLRGLPPDLVHDRETAGRSLAIAGVEPQARPGTLTPRQWSALSDALAVS